MARNIVPILDGPVKEFLDAAEQAVERMRSLRTDLAEIEMKIRDHEEMVARFLSDSDRQEFLKVDWARLAKFSRRS